MVRYIYARYKGDRDDYYQNNQNYPLAVKTRFWSKKISVYKRRGYYDEMSPGSLRNFKNEESFNQTFQFIKED